MNKKQLAELIETLVAEVASAAGLSEAEARTVTGIAIKRNLKGLVASISGAGASAKLEGVASV